MSEQDDATPRSWLPRPDGFHRVGAKPDRWVDSTGADVTDADDIARLRKLAAVPPAWDHVWASTDPDNPIQATGVDARGRTQYRYSTAATTTAATNKFAHMLSFAAALPDLREQVAADLRSHPKSRKEVEADQVLAAIVRLLDKGLFRIGNERYARDNQTYGLTTMRRAQLTERAGHLTFDFIGKEHLQHRITVHDPDVAVVVRALTSRDLADDEAVFSVGRPPAVRHMTSFAVNAYLHAHTRAPATAKVFRTWGATVTAAAVVGGATTEASPGTKVRADVRGIKAAADLLGDTTSVARKAYVHPGALQAGRTSGVAEAVAAASRRAGTDDVRSIFFDNEIQLAVLNALREPVAV